MKIITALLLTIMTTCLLLSKEKQTERTKYIDLRNIDFKHVFKTNDGNWTQVEVELVALDTSSNKQNPEYFKNVEITVTMAYPYKTDDASSKDNKNMFTFFRAKAMLRTLKEKRIVKMYFYLPGDIVEYYQLAKRPKYAYVNFTINGLELPPHTDYLYGRLAPEDLALFLERAESRLEETKGHLLPYHLAPEHVKEGMDFEKLPTISREDESDE